MKNIWCQCVSTAPAAVAAAAAIRIRMSCVLIINFFLNSKTDKFDNFFLVVFKNKYILNIFNDDY